MKNKQPLVIVLMGPTASGKTDLSIEIAKTLNLDIHNVDSRQLYIGMDIGTAKPTRSQQSLIKHFLLDLRQPNDPITLHEFQKEAIISLQKNLNEKKIGFLVGGSGLYLKSLISGLVPPAIPAQHILRHQFKAIGQKTCHQLLQHCDPIGAKKIAPADISRTIRALEVFYATGKTMSSLQSIKPPPWRFLELGLNPKNLNERIAKRTRHIFENGLLEETQKLIYKFGRDLSLLKTIGYKEALKVLEGTSSIEEAIAMATVRTNQFAKKQKTWFKGQHKTKWLNEKNPLSEALSLIETL
tara:strand:- start:15 stop:908 length:894 start_codon:yes stop_codon:yes gene_type:complete